MTTDVEVGDFVMAREDEDTNIVDLGTMSKADNKSFEITCYVWTSANVLTSKHLPVWTYKNNDQHLSMSYGTLHSRAKQREKHSMRSQYLRASST